MSDPEVLAHAANQNRILVTHDQKTMPRHFAIFIAMRSSPGVLIVPQHLPLSVVARDLILIWQASAPEEWKDRIFYLPI